MTATLDYARPASPPHSRIVGRAAAALLLYPLLLAATLYGPWFVGWLVLGHPPRPLLDDPEYPGSALLRGLSVVTVLAAVPAGCVALALNVLHLAMTWSAATRTRVAVRLALLIAPWLVLFSLFNWDPGHVFTWWFD